MTKHINNIISERSIRYNRRNNLKIGPLTKAILINNKMRQALTESKQVVWITWVKNEGNLKYTKKVEKTNKLNQVFKYAFS